MLKIIQFNIIMLVLLVFASCENKKENNRVDLDTQKLNAEVIYPAGSLVLGFEQGGIPSCFNIASLDNIDELDNVLILGERLEKGKKIAVKPIGILSFKKDTMLNQFILASILDENIIGMKANSFLEFSTKQSELKYLVENWFKANCQLGKCSDFNWQNDISAKSLIDKMANNKTK